VAGVVLAKFFDWRQDVLNGPYIETREARQASIRRMNRKR
jgi:hypothetical protein